MTPSAPETDKLPQTVAGANVRPGLAAHSRFVQRIRRRYANELTLLAPGLPSQAHMVSTLQVLNDKGYDLGASLRILRQLVIERLAVLDCECAASAQDVTQTATTLAEFTLDKAVTAAQQSLKEIHGAPMIDPDNEAAGEPKEATLWVVGMGKLGARELNVSSDIDLIYVYDGDGRTTGNAHGLQRISNQAFFAKVVRQVYQLIGESTEHGFVFR
ncbi:MAG: glutamine-synthetase adenylyltransferase, partial [Burkholderiaceae bacterium]